MGSCAGTEGAAIFGCALLSTFHPLSGPFVFVPPSDIAAWLPRTASYLFLFIAFYQRTYKKTNTAAAKVAATKVAKKLQ
jgi:hypothetical protein